MRVGSFLVYIPTGADCGLVDDRVFEVLEDIKEDTPIKLYKRYFVGKSGERAFWGTSSSCELDIHEYVFYVTEVDKYTEDQFSNILLGIMSKVQRPDSFMIFFKVQFNDLIHSMHNQNAARTELQTIASAFAGQNELKELVNDWVKNTLNPDLVFKDMWDEAKKRAKEGRTRATFSFPYDAKALNHVDIKQDSLGEVMAKVAYKFKEAGVEFNFKWDGGWHRFVVNVNWGV